MFALIALILFILAAFSVTFGSVNLIALGLACLAAHILLGAIGYPLLPGRRGVVG